MKLKVTLTLAISSLLAGVQTLDAQETILLDTFTDGDFRVAESFGGSSNVSLFTVGGSNLVPTEAGGNLSVGWS